MGESNYLKMAERARSLFLEKDARAAAALWGLRTDGAYLYASLFGSPLRVRFSDGGVEPGGEGAYLTNGGVEETMILFDLLFYPLERTGLRPTASGTWSSVGELGGVIGAGHRRLLRNEGFAGRFDGRLDAFRSACERLGGTPFGKADAGYILPVFADFRLGLQFWEGDEEFPANAEFLFDSNALSYMHYETLWYVTGLAKERLLAPA